jgi:hypothetical protein
MVKSPSTLSPISILPAMHFHLLGKVEGILQLSFCLRNQFIIRAFGVCQKFYEKQGTRYGSKGMMRAWEERQQNVE